MWKPVWFVVIIKIYFMTDRKRIFNNPTGNFQSGRYIIKGESSKLHTKKG